MEVAKQLAQVAESAHHHILGEESDWFDKISVNRNMKSLKGNVMEFQKTAKEAHMLNQRLTALYEDIGGVLNRYYEIDEALDTVDTDKVEPGDDFEDREDKDIDNDGDSDDSDEFLHKKRKAITKAVKGEAVGDSNNMDQVDRPNAPAKDGRDNENEALDYDKGPAKDGNNSRDQYASSDGEEMKESSQSDPHNVDGHNSTGGDEPSRDGDEMKEAMRQTREKMNKRPIRRLKDIGNISTGIPALGDLIRKK